MKRQNFKSRLGRKFQNYVSKGQTVPIPTFRFRESAHKLAEGQVSRGFCLFPTVLPFPYPLLYLFFALGVLLCSHENLFPPHSTSSILLRTVSLIGSAILGRHKLFIGMHGTLSPSQADNRGGILARPGNEVLNLL